MLEEVICVYSIVLFGNRHHLLSMTKSYIETLLFSYCDLFRIDGDAGTACAEVREVFSVTATDIKDTFRRKAGRRKEPLERSGSAHGTKALLNRAHIRILAPQHLSDGCDSSGW